MHNPMIMMVLLVCRHDDDEGAYFYRNLDLLFEEIGFFQN